MGRGRRGGGCGILERQVKIGKAVKIFIERHFIKCH